MKETEVLKRLKKRARIFLSITLNDFYSNFINIKYIPLPVTESFSPPCFDSVFKELLTRPEHDHDLDGEEEHDRKNGAPHLPKIGDIKKASRYSIPDLAVDVEQVMGLEKVSKKAKTNTVGGRNKLKKIFDKTLTRDRKSVV